MKLILFKFETSSFPVEVGRRVQSRSLAKEPVNYDDLSLSPFELSKARYLSPTIKIVQNDLQLSFKVKQRHLQFLTDLTNTYFHGNGFTGIL